MKWIFYTILIAEVLNIRVYCWEKIYNYIRNPMDAALIIILCLIGITIAELKEK